MEDNIQKDSVRLSIMPTGSIDVNDRAAVAKLISNTNNTTARLGRKIHLHDTVRIYVDNYLADKISIDDLRKAIAPILWDLDDIEEEIEGSEFAYEIALLLDEYSYGHWGAEDIKRLIINIVQKY